MNEQEMERELTVTKKMLGEATERNISLQKEVATLRKDLEALPAAQEYVQLLEKNKQELVDRISVGEQQLQTLQQQNDALKNLCIGALDRIVTVLTPKMPPQQPTP